MAGDIEDLSTEIKERYPTGIWETMQNREAKYRASLKKENLKQETGGLFKWPLRTRSSWNIGARNDGTALPTPYDPQRLKAQMSPVAFYGSIAVGMKSKYALTDAKSTWSDDGITGDRIEETAEDVTKYINMVYAGSVLGRLANVESDGTSTFVASKPQGVTCLREGMLLEARDALTSGSVVDSFSAHRITTIDEDTRTVTYTNAAGSADDRTLVAGNHIFISGDYAELGSVYSLRHIVDDANDSVADIFGNSRSTYPKLKAQIFGAGGVLRNLDEQLLLRAIDAPARRAGKRITRAIANSGQGRKYVEFAAADRRYPGATRGTQNYSVGYGDDSLQIVAPGVNCTLELERDVHPRTIYLLAWDTFFLQQARELDWVDEGGGLLKLIPGSGVYSSGFHGYMAAVECQGNRMPPANSRIDDLADDLLGDSI